MVRLSLILGIIVVLTACGSTSEAEIQQAVQAAIAATTEANIAATNEAQTATAIAQTATAEAEAAASATAAAEACSRDGLIAYGNDLDAQLVRYDRQYNLASSTPRMSLGEPMQRLLDVQEETAQMDVPPCLISFHDEVITMMDTYQQSLQNFAAQGPDSTTTQLMAEATKQHGDIYFGIQRLQRGEFPKGVSQTNIDY